MIYYTFGEILGGIAYAVFFGILFCAVSVVLDVTFDFFGAFLHSFKDAACFSKNKESMKSYLRKARRIEKKRSKVGVFISDLIFCCICGFLTSLLLYVSSDAEIRAYVLLISIASYKLSKSLIGRYLYFGASWLIKNVFYLFSAILILTMFTFRFSFTKAFAFSKRRFSRKKREERKKRIVQNGLKNRNFDRN